MSMLSHSVTPRAYRSLKTLAHAILPCVQLTSMVYSSHINGHKYVKLGMSSMLHTRAGKQQLFAVLNQSFYHQYLVINNKTFLLTIH